MLENFGESIESPWLRSLDGHNKAGPTPPAPPQDDLKEAVDGQRIVQLVVIPVSAFLGCLIIAVFCYWVNMRSRLYYIARKKVKKAPEPLEIGADSSGRVSLVDIELKNNTRSPEKVYPIRQSTDVDLRGSDAFRFLRPVQSNEQIPITGVNSNDIQEVAEGLEKPTDPSFFSAQKGGD